MVVEEESKRTLVDKGRCFAELALFLSSVFGGLAEEELEELCDSIFRVEYGHGDLIIQEGSHFSGLYIVYRGLVKIGKYASTGKRRVLRFLAPKELFGLEALFMPGQQTNIQFARALVDSELIFIEKRVLLNFLERHPQALFALCRWFAREVAMLEFKLTRDATEGSIQNFSMLLLALNNKYGMKTDSGSQIDLELSRQTLANILGISIETLMRLMKSLKERGIISSENNKITIIDEEKLDGIAQTSDFYLSILEETF